MSASTQQEIDRLIEQFDPESSFRRLAGFAALFVTVMTVGLSAWHYYTAGFGLENEIAHRAIHLTVVLGLCFLVFPRQKRLPGPWEWISSLVLVAFYLMLGFRLLAAISDPIPPVAQGRLHRRVVVHCRPVAAVQGLRWQPYPDSAARLDLRRAGLGFLACTCWSIFHKSSSSARANTHRST